MEPINFCLANEDYNVYQFDMRSLDQALMIHKDHTAAVMDVAYSPSGREFVTASYDRTVRIFKCREGHSRDIYHTKRMQRVFTVNYSSDSQFVISGSDDMNLRIWKAEASAHVGVQNSRAERKEKLDKALKKRYAHMPEIKRIHRDKPIPKSIKKARDLQHEQKISVSRKRDNRKRHSKPGSMEMVPEKKRQVIKEFE
jgi:WD repeat and SOF domain-containing protein 1